MSFLICKLGIVIPQMLLWGSTYHFAWCSENRSVQVLDIRPQRPAAYALALVPSNLSPQPSAEPVHHSSAAFLPCPAAPAAGQKYEAVKRQTWGRGSLTREDPPTPGNRELPQALQCQHGLGTPPHASGIRGPGEAAASRQPATAPTSSGSTCPPIFQPLLSTTIKGAFAF